MVRRRIEHLENESVPLVYYIGTFVTVLFLRNLLELFVYRYQYFAFTQMAIYYNLFFISVMLSIMLVFILATRERIERIARVLMASFTLILSAPLIDLLIYGRRGYQITYLLTTNTWRDFFLNLITYFGPLEPEIGVSLGMRTEILIILSLSFIYLIYKSRNVIKSVFYTFLIYVIIYSFLGIPFLVQEGFGIIGLGHLSREILETQFRIALYLLISLILIFIILCLTKWKYMSNILMDIRPFRLAHYQMMFMIGLFFGHRMNALELTGNTLFSIILTTMAITFAWLFSVFTNNIEDVGIDRVSNIERPLVSGAFSLDTYKRISLVLLMLVLACSLVAGYVSLFFVALFTGNYFLYSMPPFRLKRIPVFSKMIIGLNSLLLFVLGHSYTGALFDIPLMVPVFFLTIYSLAINIIDIKDHEGDLEEGIKTLPVLLGLKRAKVLIGAFFGVAVFSSYILVREIFSLNPYLSMITMLALGGVGALEFYLITREDYKESTVFFVYLCLLFVFTYLMYVLPH